jgi:hypothetical protein
MLQPHARERGRREGRRRGRGERGSTGRALADRTGLGARAAGCRQQHRRGEQRARAPSADATTSGRPGVPSGRPGSWVDHILRLAASFANGGRRSRRSPPAGAPPRPRERSTRLRVRRRTLRSGRFHRQGSAHEEHLAMPLLEQILDKEPSNAAAKLWLAYCGIHFLLDEASLRRAVRPCSPSRRVDPQMVVRL